MKTDSKQLKELAKNILATVKTITPELEKVAQDAPFEITITNSEKGIRIEMCLDWDPTLDDAEVCEATDNVDVYEHETNLIKAALAKAKGKIHDAADMCGMSFRSFKKAMSQHNVEE